MATNQTTTATQKVANRLVELCRAGNFDVAQDELFSKDATSTEPETSQAPVKTVKGFAAIKEKGKQWQDMVEKMNGGSVSEPLVAADHFTVAMNTDVTMKDGKRMVMDELVVYKVKDGKIVSEEFFY